MIRDILFATVLIYAAATDIRTRTVPNHVLLLLLAVGLIGVSWASIEWALIVFALLFLTALISNLGGGDVKFSTLCAFVMGDSKILWALLLGLSACIPAVALYCLLQHKPIKGTSFPLVPFLSAGCLTMMFLK